MGSQNGRLCIEEVADVSEYSAAGPFAGRTPEWPTLTNFALGLQLNSTSTFGQFCLSQNALPSHLSDGSCFVLRRHLNSLLFVQHNMQPEKSMRMWAAKISLKPQRVSSIIAIPKSFFVCPSFVDCLILLIVPEFLSEYRSRYIKSLLRDNMDEKAYQQYNQYMHFNAMYGIEPGDFDAMDFILTDMEESRQGDSASFREDGRPETNGDTNANVGSSGGTQHGELLPVEKSGLHINEVQRGCLLDNGFFGSLHHFASSYGFNLENEHGQRRVK
ncbi:hypothetical protein HYALB_00003297 [Hymenoscyphus albidus]|uniref:Uncharacterized protein n=1 Tax=Hymenoscyphus albidus TaxID=595503 RepID=A0A9N9LI46_9HELO|nr:hypothetical protein HYALB_00003297 [Hymenoscyphus albidus]